MIHQKTNILITKNIFNPSINESMAVEEYTRNVFSFSFLLERQWKFHFVRTNEMRKIEITRPISNVAKCMFVSLIIMFHVNTNNWFLS